MKEDHARTQAILLYRIPIVIWWQSGINSVTHRSWSATENVSCYQQKIGKWKPASILPLYHLYSINTESKSYFIFSLWQIYLSNWMFPFHRTGNFTHIEIHNHSFSYGNFYSSSIPAWESSFYYFELCKETPDLAVTECI